ncbi:VanW family protein [Patescibacteria group bacterium]|nr:VanW family protein [Patescibacteria group bacterium]
MQGKAKKIAAAISTAGFCGLAFWVQITYGDMVPAGTMVANIAVGTQDMQEAAAIIEAEIDAFSANPITIIYEDSVHAFSAESLGVDFDTKSTLKKIPTMTSLTGRKGSIRISANIDEDKMAHTLSIISAGKEPVNAHIFLSSESGETEISPSSPGSTVDLQQMTALLAEKTANLSEEAIILPLKQIEPEVLEKDLEPFLADAKQIFSREITIIHNGQEWIFNPGDYADWFNFGTKSSIKIKGFGEMDLIMDQDIPGVEKSLNITVDRAKADAYITENLSPEIEIEPQDVVISMDENGKITFEGTGVNGAKVNNQAFSEMLVLAMESGVASFHAPTSIKKAGVNAPSELQELGIKELIATGYSNFYGSPYNRNINIQVGLSKFDGLVIGPGETFSFIENLGEVDADAGYYRELVIKENETIPEYGGGLCQVSSTLFRAILYGGFPIVARTEHSYAVSYYAYPYGYGLDATIYQPWPDLQFTNDTENHILIQAYAEGSSAYFKFYGTSDGRQAIMDGPYYSGYTEPPPDIIEYTTQLTPGTRVQKDTAHMGFSATWYRTVIYPDGEKYTETIASKYQAWPAKYQVGISETEPLN